MRFNPTQIRIGWPWLAISDITLGEMKPIVNKASQESPAHLPSPPALGAVLPPLVPPVSTGISGLNRRRMRSPHAEHRQAQRLRVEESQRLVELYPELTGLKGNLEFVDREGASRATEMKYNANLEHLKSVLVFTCPVPECTGGDFDLTAKLAEAVSKRKPMLTGDIPCLGTHKKASGKLLPCRRVLHYTLKLAYSKRQ